MRAVQFDQVLTYRDDVALGPVAEGDVVVDVLLAGICETDLQLCRGYMGFSGTLGHEFVGVARSGPFAGRRVVGEINCYCNQCDYCLRGLTNHCPGRTVIGILKHDGAFADSVLVPQRNLHSVPDSVSNEHAVFVEPIAAACRIPEQLPAIVGQAVIVLGDGRLGNLCAQVLNYHGCDVTVVGKHQFKLNLLDKLGIRNRSLESTADLNRVDYIIDCTGSPSGFKTALSLVKPSGCIVLKTTVAAEHAVHLASLVIDEVRVVGSRCGPFADAIDLLQRDAVCTDILISDRFPIAEAVSAFDRAMEKDAMKVLLDIADSAS